MASLRFLCLLLAAASWTGTSAQSAKHSQAPIFSVNGTFNTHFSARVTGLQPGGCVIFEAQARAPQKDGELCIAGAGVRLTGITAKGAHPLDAGRLLPHGCSEKGLRIAEVITDNPKDCFLQKAQLLENPVNVVHDCDAESPYSYQFIDPTRHDVQYGDKVYNPIGKLCQALLEDLPAVGSRNTHGRVIALDRIHHSSFDGKCLKSATYVVANPCNGAVPAMLVEGVSSQCTTGASGGDSDGPAFPQCTRHEGGNGKVVAAFLVDMFSGLAVVVVILAAAAAAAVLLMRRRRAGTAAAGFGEDSGLRSGMPDSSANEFDDPEK